jgi:hypothetical protein
VAPWKEGHDKSPMWEPEGEEVNGGRTLAPPLAGVSGVTPGVRKNLRNHCQKGSCSVWVCEVCPLLGPVLGVGCPSSMEGCGYLTFTTPQATPLWPLPTRCSNTWCQMPDVVI